MTKFDWPAEGLSKAEASKRIDKLKDALGRD